MLRTAVVYPAAPRRLGRFVTVGLLCLSLASLGVVWARAVSSLARPKPVPVRVKPSAFAWGDRVFSDRSSFETWLRSRGMSYGEWARLHPAAVGILYPRAKHAVPAARRQAAPATTRPIAQPPAASANAERATGHVIDLTSVLPWVGMVFALLPIVLAAALSVLRPLRRRLARLPVVRLYLVGASATMLSGLLIGHLIG